MSKRKYKQRADGRYTASVTIGKLPNGNPKRKYVYASSPTELDKKITELKNNYYKGTIADDSISFQQWSNKWFNLNMENKQYRTQKEVRNLLDKYILPKIGTIKIKDLKQYHIKELVVNMDNIPTTANKSLQLIKRILKEASVNDVIYKNVAEGITPLKRIKTEKKPLTIQEDNILYNTSINNKYGAFIMCMRYLGLRREEVVALTIDDIDLNNKLVNVNKAVTFINNQPVVKNTKNNKPRKVDIPDILIPFLENQIKENEHYLFTKQTDKKSMLSETATKRILENFLKDSGIKFTFHQLRHSYCTMLYYAGIGIKKAQELLGHSSADMIYNIYTHLDEEKENSRCQINDYVVKMQSNFNIQNM